MEVQFPDLIFLKHAFKKSGSVFGGGWNSSAIITEIFPASPANRLCFFSILIQWVFEVRELCGTLVGPWVIGRTYFTSK